MKGNLVEMEGKKYISYTIPSNLIDVNPRFKLIELDNDSYNFLQNEDIELGDKVKFEIHSYWVNEEDIWDGKPSPNDILVERAHIIFKKSCKSCNQTEPIHKMSCPTKKMIIQLQNKTNKELKIESILNFVHQSLQWENGEIGGIDMDYLENKLNSIL